MASVTLAAYTVRIRRRRSDQNLQLGRSNGAADLLPVILGGLQRLQQAGSVVDHDYDTGRTSLSDAIVFALIPTLFSLGAVILIRRIDEGCPSGSNSSYVQSGIHGHGRSSSVPYRKLLFYVADDSEARSHTAQERVLRLSRSNASNSALVP